MAIIQKFFFPPEWTPQGGIQLTWPDAQTDWAGQLPEVTAVYEKIAREILKQESLLIVCRNQQYLPSFLQKKTAGLLVCEMPINDTWTRDHGALTVIEQGNPVLLNFRFNGWGLKFPANADNQITSTLIRKKAYAPQVTIKNHTDFTLEGGSVESNGKGCLLTTSRCLLSKNRNERFSQTEIELFLRKTFHAEKVLWLDNGFIEGDDTDSHIDTLARFCAPDTIAYVRCNNPEDGHFLPLQRMEAQLRQFTDQLQHPFKLVPLPWPDPVIEEGQRLPATYANFLILNKAVLLPVYRVSQDQEALTIMRRLFPNREIIPIDSVPLIRQHGSIHCITMQYPKNTLAI